MSHGSQSALDRMEVLLMRHTGESGTLIEARNTLSLARRLQQNDAEIFGVGRAYAVEEHCIG